MKLVCLCPTYGRPRALLENSIACFLHQNYPANKRRLIILDDLGNIAEQKGDGWKVYSTQVRFPSLPHKYARLLELCGDDWDAVVVWDDDDIYLPWHLSAHAAALAQHGWSHPSRVFSLCGAHDGIPVMEPAAGRFHGAAAVRRQLINDVDGWLGVMPDGEERRADFDQRLLAALSRIEPAGDPLRHFRTPSYIYGWGRARHCSALMRSPSDLTWYERHRASTRTGIRELQPILPALMNRLTQF